MGVSECAEIFRSMQEDRCNGKDSFVSTDHDDSFEVSIQEYKRVKMPQPLLELDANLFSHFYTRSILFLRNLSSINFTLSD